MINIDHEILWYLAKNQMRKIDEVTAHEITVHMNKMRVEKLSSIWEWRSLRVL